MGKDTIGEFINDKQPDQLIINFDQIRSENKEIDKILNSLSVPTLRNEIKDIFSDGGLIVHGYKFKAQPYLGAFYLKVERINEIGKERGITFSPRELLTKGWIKNIKLSDKAKQILELIHEIFIVKYKENFNRVIKDQKSDQPLDMMRFTYGRVVKPQTIVYVICPQTGNSKPFSMCYDCKDLIHEDQGKITCRLVKKID